MNITSKGVIDRPVDQVWNVLRDFAGLKAWHPGIVTCETEGTGVGALRRVTLADGRAATERLDELDEDRHVLAYSVTESVRPATVGVLATITLTEAGDDATTVTWTVSPPESDGLTDDIIEGMRAYYPTRIKNLADAVGGDVTPA